MCTRNRNSGAMSKKLFGRKKDDKSKKQRQAAKDLGLSDKEFEDIKKTFCLFDQDGNGQITRSELKNVVRMLGHTMTEAEIEAMMRRADSDGSGSIEFEEFLPLIAEKMKSTTAKDKEMRDAFRAFDQNGDGVISISELRLAMAKMGQRLTDAEIEAMIRDVDKDGDGYVNFEEFKKFMS